MKRESLKRRDAGFSLLEMMISILILLIVSGTAFQALSYYQKNYLSTQIRVDMHSSVRAAIELLSQEIGQAGLLTFKPRTLNADITGGSSPQSVALSDLSDIFAQEKLLIDAGDLQELVTVTAVNASTITGIFSKNHASGAPVTAAGVFPHGILTDTDGPQLQLFGDLYGDGTLVFAQYDCNFATGTFSRSVTPVSAASINPSQVLVSNVTQNPPEAGPPALPMGLPCFRFTKKIISGFSFVTGVAITLSVRTAQKDPQTNNYVTMTKSFLNISPRNVLTGLDDAQNAIITRLQTTPLNLPLH